MPAVSDPDAEPAKTSVNVSGIEVDVFERIRAVTRKLGINSDAATLRFAIQQFADGKSIADFDLKSPDAAEQRGERA